LGTKTNLRKVLKRELSSISDLEHSELSLRVSKNLNQLLRSLDVIQKHFVIGVFSPIEKEPLWFLEMENDFKKLMAYPAFDKEMIYRSALMSELKVSRDFGADILGPTIDQPIVSPSIVIVPGLGFTPDGKRLGRGKGFYDRYFEKSPAIKIGIAFEMQIIKDIPTEPHDVKMDFVVTDQSTYRIN
jgi:5-formyltetrahydrofolate cyclo-ligase